MDTSDSLERCYSVLMQTSTLPTDIQARLWNCWLWGTAVNQALIDECGDMNLNQGIGVFMCVMLSHTYAASSDDRCIVDILPHSPLVHLTKVPIHSLTQRQLSDQVECLQLSWGSVVGSHEHLEGLCRRLLCLLMARLGVLVQHTYSGAPTPLDAIQYTTILPASGGSSGEPTLYIVTRKYIRQLCCMFVILFRTLEITGTAHVVPLLETADSQRIKESFQEHHLECSCDFFSTLQQMVQLAPAMRLVYRTDFSGMYNDVSQVVYFHYPQYHRQAQLSLGDIPDSAINCLPLLTQILPQVPVVYDDDDVIPGLTWYSVVPNDPPKFAWLVSCATVFLVEIDYERKCSRIMASPDAGLVPLIAHFISVTGSSLSVASGNVRVRKINMASHSHVELSQMP